ncbi:Factor arrest protein 11, partial [Kappamyces sp. JEL0680]
YSVFNPPFSASATTQIPDAILQGDAIAQKYFYPSAAPLQLEMEKTLKLLDTKLGAQFGSSIGSEKNHTKPKSTVSSSPVLARTRKLYEDLFPTLGSHITMLVRLLFYLNVSSAATSSESGEGSAASFESLSPAERLKEVGKRDASRHKEIITRTISHLLLNLVKVAKRYPQISLPRFANPALQKAKKAPVLEDNADVDDLSIGTSWLSERALPKELDFFLVCQAASEPRQDPQPPTQGVSTTSQVPPSDLALPQKKYASKRNVETTAMLLRLLQKLTKQKTNRILAMVQWKAQAVLKRILKVRVDSISEPTLKLLKSQIPYLGKKWRSNNMMVISQIFMTIGHRLREEYLCGEGDTDPVEAQKKDGELRELVAFFHQRMFGEQNTLVAKHISDLDLELNDWIETQNIPSIPHHVYDDHDQDQAWVESLVVDELDSPGESQDLFEIPSSWNMELLEEESLMSSFEVSTGDEFQEEWTDGMLF